MPEPTQEAVNVRARETVRPGDGQVGAHPGTPHRTTTPAATGIGRSPSAGATKDAHAVEADLADAVVDAVCDGSLWSIRNKYDIEAADDDLDPLVLVAKTDGARYQVEIEVFVTTLPPLVQAGVPADQQMLPLGDADA